MKETHTLSDATATAHNFDTEEDARRALKMKAFVIQDWEPKIDLDDFDRCIPVECTLDDHPRQGLKLEAVK